MAKEGIRCTSGYVTAPQCSPSRAGLLTGRYQQRLGIDQIPDMPLPLKAVTIAERLRPAGYTSAMIGKWHLEPNEVTRKWMQENGIEKLAPKDTLPFFPGAQGFDFYYKGELNRYYANYLLDGTPREPGWVNQPRFRVDVQTDAALAFIDQHHKEPFFVYLNYFAPHTPLEVPPAYLKPEWKNLPLRRQAALSMIAAVDHGVGRLGERLSATMFAGPASALARTAATQPALLAHSIAAWRALCEARAARGAPCLSPVPSHAARHPRAPACPSPAPATHLLTFSCCLASSSSSCDRSLS
jgi:arylsulfatase A-like enzyme